MTSNKKMRKFSGSSTALSLTLSALTFSACTLMLTSCSNIPAASKREAPAYLNPNLTIEERVQDLVSRMTTEEKIAQLYNDAPAIERLNVDEYNWWNESLHGVARAGKATVFPQAIGMAATFNGPLINQVATAISDEGRAKYHYFKQNDVVFRYTGLTFWSPNVNIFRDPRWGRGQETYGEDPYLTATLAKQFIRGLQGDDEQYLKTAAMAKHFAVHSGPEKSRHSDNYHTTPKDLWETYLPAFEMSVKEANVEAVMCAYNRVNDEPACGSGELLQEILRDKWQFTGHVVSDCGALADFYDPKAHSVTYAPASAAAWALLAGTDLNCGTMRLSTFANLNFALQRGMVEESDIDQAVSRLFTTRFKLGMFDPDDRVPYSQIPMSSVGSTTHLSLAETTSEESFVLLKNNGVLPLQKDIRVAVIGPNAENPSVLVGNYHGDPISPVTPLQGIAAFLGEDKVQFAAGSTIVDDHHGYRPVISEAHFFHQSTSGEIEPGLVARYFEAAIDPRPKLKPETRIRISPKGPAKMQRVDANIDFYWQNSPVDNSVWDEFAVTWEGYIKPEVSGEYRFYATRSVQFDLTIDGKAIGDQAVQLKADTLYPFKAQAAFARSWWGSNALEPKVQLSWVNQQANLLQQAINAAQKSDVVIFVSGISPEVEGEEMRVELDGFDGGDRIRIDLPQSQQSLLKQLKALGKPIVLVNLSGSAVAMNWEKQNVDAILQGFYPGEATGTALAKLLWGEANPSGKLPVTFYKDLKGLPGFTDYSMDNRTYKFYRGTPLFPFGHGLSYSQFQYSGAETSHLSDGELLVQFTVTNRSERAGAEVSQLYMELLDAPEHTAKRELVGYRKDTIQGHETVELALHIKPLQISYVSKTGQRIPYTGRVRFSIGGGQPGFEGSSNIVEWEWTNRKH